MEFIDIKKASELLKDSQVVALPTETVYGLAGLITSEDALKKIFSVKARPFFDPLIVHVQSLAQAETLAHFDPISRLLAENFWPGPLTLVLRKKEAISDLITNGGPTVALRSPHHPFFQKVLTLVGAPLAAPSANMFGKTSPTTAAHVYQEFSGTVPVVDGGACEKGIESTIVEVLPQENTLRILRPGMIHEADFQKLFQKKQISFTIEKKSLDHAPGHLQNHYQPSIPFLLVEERRQDSDYLKTLQSLSKEKWTALELPSDATLAARQLYGKLRFHSSQDQALFLVVKSPWMQDPHWEGLLDRIQKASTGRIFFNNSGEWVHSSKQ